MLALEERFMIRELYRKGVSISEIARRTGRDRKTIRQAVNAPDLLKPLHSRQVKACKIDPYASYLEQRMAEGVLNARKLYGEIVAQGYPGKESKVREFVHERRPEKEPLGSVRFETAPGEQGQVDWGYFGFITHHEHTYRLYAFVMTLGWSRASYLHFTISADTTWFIRCHLHAFTYLGGVPKRLLYDNLKSVVLRRDAEDVVHWNPRFLDFADVAGFAPQACKPYRPQTNAFVERYHRSYKQECLQIHRPATLQEVREVTEQFMQHYNQERPHQGRSCKNQPPRVAFPTLPVLPPLPEKVDPDRWLQSIHGQAFARRVGPDGCVDVDLEPYYIKQAFAGTPVVLFVNAPQKVFQVWHEGALIKEVPIKGLYGQELPFDRYVTLIKQEARSEQRRKPAMRRSFHQLRLWA